MVSYMTKAIKVGPYHPTNALERGVYTGANPDLKGETAIISRCQSGWYVQVDNRASGLAFGWWWFALEDWGRV